MHKLFILFSISFTIASCCNNGSCKVKQDGATTTIDSTTEEIPAQVAGLIKTTYIGTNNDTLHATFINQEERAEFTFKGQPFNLPQQRTASGSKYANGTYEFVEWHDEVTLTKSGKVIFTNVPKK